LAAVLLGRRARTKNSARDERLPLSVTSSAIQDAVRKRDSLLLHDQKVAYSPRRPYSARPLGTVDKAGKVNKYRAKCPPPVSFVAIGAVCSHRRLFDRAGCRHLPRCCGCRGSRGGSRLVQANSQPVNGSPGSACGKWPALPLASPPVRLCWQPALPPQPLIGRRIGGVC
jgi:hypothetical protein